MVRTVLSDGQGWRRTAKASVAIKAGPVKTTGGSLRRCFGSCAPVRQARSAGQARQLEERFQALPGVYRRPHRRTGQPCPVRTPARPSLRHRRCAAVDRWLGVRCPHRRQGLRFELARRRSGRSWGESRDLPAPPTPGAPRYRLDHVWLAPSHRELLLRLENFKRVATRSDKTDDSYKAMVCAAATLLHSRK